MVNCIDIVELANTHPRVAIHKQGVEVVIYDPYCDESFGARRADDLTSAVTKADCIVIATDHLVFKTLNLDEIKLSMKKRPVIVDGRRTIHSEEARNHGFIYVSMGCLKQINKLDKASLTENKGLRIKYR